MYRARTSHPDDDTHRSLCQERRLIRPAIAILSIDCVGLENGRRQRLRFGTNEGGEVVRLVITKAPHCCPTALLSLSSQVGQVLMI